MQQASATKNVKVREICSAMATLPRVLRLVWDSGPALVAAMAFIMLLQGITPLATVIIARMLIDGAARGILLGSLQPLLLPVILQLLLNLLAHGCTRLYSMLQTLLNHRLSDHLNMLILRKVSTLDLASFENPEFYDRLTRTRQQVINKPLLIIVQLFNLGSSLVTMLSLLALLFQLSWWLALIALLVPIPSFFVNSRYGLGNYWMALWQSSSKRQQLYIVDLLTTDACHKEIKQFNLADFFIARYHALSKQMYQEDRALQTRHTALNLLWSLLPLLANTGLYLFIALQTIQRRITLGALTQYSIAINEVNQHCQAMLDSLSSLYEHQLFISMLFDFLAYQPKIVAPDHPVPFNPPTHTSPTARRPQPSGRPQGIVPTILRTEQAIGGEYSRAALDHPTGTLPSPARPLRSPEGLDIAFHNVSFSYPGKSEPVLNKISFTLHAGESIALVGQNGAGKTTLIKLLTRLYDPDEGEIHIGGRNIKEYDPQALREQIGIIFQDYVKYQMTAGQNIGIGRIAEIENREQIQAAAHKSGAASIIERLERGYETMLGRRFEQGVELSGGEWQKLALARAFMRDAPILVLDEPTSALDARAEYDIFQRFSQLSAGRTVIFVSHRFSTVRLADRIFVLEGGQIVECGSHQQLLEMGGKYAELFNLQAEAYR